MMFFFFTDRLTLRITGKIKLHSEAAQLYFVRVYAFVMHYFLKHRIQLNIPMEEADNIPKNIRR